MILKSRGRGVVGHDPTHGALHLEQHVEKLEVRSCVASRHLRSEDSSNADSQRADYGPEMERLRGESFLR